MRRLRRALVAAIAVVLVGACSSSGGGGAKSATASTRASNPSARTPTTARGNAVASTAPAQSAPQQRYETALPIPIQEAAAATTGDRLYVVGGYDVNRNSSSAVFVLNGTTWSRGPSLPIAVNHPGAAAINRDVYVAGGFARSIATNRVFVLTAGSSSWRELAPMRHARGALALLAFDGRLYAVGGRDASTQIAEPEVYDPSAGTWSALANMPAPRNHVAGYIDGSLLCVAGGRTPDTSAAIDCFDPATDAWQSHGAVPTGTSGAAAGLIDGATIVAGGEPAGETSIVGVVQILGNGAWSTTPMLVPRHGAATAIFRGRLWACGGATAPGFQAVAACTSIIG